MTEASNDPGNAGPSSPAEAPPWRDAQALRESLPTEVSPWLLDDGSLTQRLIDTGRDFSVERLTQGWEPPACNERHFLGMDNRDTAMIRSVILKLDGEPVVFARSVFPESSLTGPLLQLRKLENESLGALLFARSDLRRSAFQVAELPCGASYLPESLQQRRPVWARRSRFEVAERPLRVSEVFLEGFPGELVARQLHRSREDPADATMGG